MATKFSRNFELLNNYLTLKLLKNEKEFNTNLFGNYSFNKLNCICRMFERRNQTSETGNAIISSASNSSKNSDEKAIEKRLKFLDVKLRIEEKKKNGGDASLIIVSWDEWGRASRKCSGWGLCNADWFPEFKQGGKPNNPNGGKTLLELDKTNNKYYIDILLADTVPSDILAEALNLTIDADFELSGEQINGKHLTFKKGDYLFSNSLGKFGGYRIYLD